MLRLIAALSGEPVGPDPVANTLRRGASPPRGPEHTSIAQSIDTLTAGIHDAVADALAELPGSVELVPGVTTDRAAQLLRTLDARRLTDAQETLGDHPRIGELRHAQRDAELLSC
jgi:hypothetical protein